MDCRTFSLIWGACLLLHEAGAVGGDADLRGVLRAREESLQPFKADVVAEYGPGDDRAELAKVTLQLADWFDRHMPDGGTTALRKKAAGYQRVPTVAPEYLRYSVSAAGQIRVERFSSAAGARRVETEPLRLSIYTGEAWKHYLEKTETTTGARTGELTIYETERENENCMEVARGAAALVNVWVADALQSPPRKRASDLRVLPWSDVLANAPVDRSSSSHSVPPGGKEPLPTLTLETAPYRNGGRGMYRFQIWFAPRWGYVPVALVTSWLNLSGVDQKPHYFPQCSAEWSAPVTVGDVTFFRKCLVRIYEEVKRPVDGLPMEKWDRAALDSFHWTYTFSNIEIGKPLDAALFDVKPIPGTEVTDETKGYRYVVGSAGEELRKTALRAQGLKSAAPNIPPFEARNRWRTTVLVVNGLFLVVLVVYGFIRYRYKSR